MNCTRGRAAAALAGAVLAAVLIRACVARRGGEPPDEGAASRISAADGVKIITLDAVVIKKSGIVSAPLAAARHRGERYLFGEVLDPRTIAPRADAVPKKTICVMIPIPETGDASITPSPARVTLPDGTVVAANPIPLRGPVEAGLIYLAPSGSSPPCPGTMLPVALPAGPEMTGCLVPDPAVVWSDGKAWVYVRRDANRFSRREIAADTRTGGGWFVSRGVSPGEQVVVNGAQLLLSDEFLSQYQITEIAE